MGQQMGANEQRRNEEVPYTKHSYPRNSEEERKEESQAAKRGITVVNPNPEGGWKSKPIELQKLEKVHRFWPILKSSIEAIPPQERITNGINYKHVLEMCKRFQEHLGESAKIVANEQQALSSRLRDIEMFSAGVLQQTIRREERLNRVQLHLQKVTEVEDTLESINFSIAHCMPLMHALNSMLPEQERLEPFKLKLELESDIEGLMDERDGEEVSNADKEEGEVYGGVVDRVEVLGKQDVEERVEVTSEQDAVVISEQNVEVISEQDVEVISEQDVEERVEVSNEEDVEERVEVTSEQDAVVISEQDVEVIGEQDVEERVEVTSEQDVEVSGEQGVMERVEVSGEQRVEVSSEQGVEVSSEEGVEVSGKESSVVSGGLLNLDSLRTEQS